MNYHNIPTTKWRDEQPDIDNSIEDTINKLYYKEITFDTFEIYMNRLLSACKILNRNKLLSDLACDNYLIVYAAIKNRYEEDKHGKN